MIIDSETLKSLLEVIINLLNGGFFSALCGAGFGAWGAHKIAEKAKDKEIILEEIRNVNVALSLAFDICNNYMVLKRQMVLPMIINYDEVRSNYEKFNLFGSEFEFRPNYETFETPSFPCEQLIKVAFEKLTINGRLISAIYTLDSHSFLLKKNG